MLCHVCESGQLVYTPGYGSHCRVTSDCRPWANGGRLAVCLRCATVQKPTTSDWAREAQDIYNGYAIYHQSSAATEQLAFDQLSGVGAPRSGRIIEAVKEHLNLDGTGRLLDIGCGSGVTLRAFSAVAPRWQFEGFDAYLQEPQRITAIPGVSAVHTGNLSDLGSEAYDCITCIHTLEHIVNPAVMLCAARALLKKNGLLIIQVPYFADNCYDLMIADHCSHFTPGTLKPLLNYAGFRIIKCSTNIIQREILVVASRGGRNIPLLASTRVVDHQHAASHALAHLDEVLQSARTVAAPGEIGIFGTPIAATWLAANLKDSVSFFVDEDLSRVGNRHLGRPVLAIHDVPPGAHVFLALMPRIAEEVSRRLAPCQFQCHLPPGYLRSHVLDDDFTTVER